jgi:hypothetical protein
MTGKYLITTDAWFYAPDGMLYRAVWREISIVEDTILGIKTNRNASNWYAKVGSDNNHVIVAGCQIHYAVKCEQRPVTTRVNDYVIEGGKVNDLERPSNIYISE